MKETIMLVACAAVLSVGFAKQGNLEYRRARRDGAIARILVHVVDDTGMDVSNASVRVFMGMNFRPKGHYVSGASDTNGLFLAEGLTCGDEIVIDVTQAGSYSSTKKICLAKMGEEHEVREGKWLPFGAKEVIELRRIRKPLDLAWQGDFVHTTNLNEWIGFDLKAMDFVSPHGRGAVADFDVRINWDGRAHKGYRGMGVKIRLTGQGAGFVVVPVRRDSSFKGPYRANVSDGYDQTSAEFYEKVLEDQTCETRLWNESSYWVVRSRCSVNDSGEVVVANYSVINSIQFSGSKEGFGGVRVIGLFNPTPNDTNLEPMSYEAKKWLKGQKSGKK
jgi:hypothetical protein